VITNITSSRVTIGDFPCTQSAQEYKTVKL
jgi:hypothetical protein